MAELRLVPVALTVWAATLAGMCWGVWAAVGVVMVLLAAACILKEYGQAVLISGLGFLAAAVTWRRMSIARRWEFGPVIVGKVSGAPIQVNGGDYLLRLALPGHPGLVPSFVPEVPAGVVSGAVVKVAGAHSESDHPGTTQVVFNGDATFSAAPTGLAAWSSQVKATFVEAVGRAVGEHSQGLIPGMVLGDTTLQTPEQKQAYVDSGLSHLSAVSGSNVAIITAAAAVFASALGLGLRARIAFAAAALTVFATLVGPEPSVLRASVTGLVGLAAVVSSSHAEPMHVLCLAVVGLVLVDSNLAVSYGFALSVAATVGIVALSPMIYRALAPTGWPNIAVRALGVAIAADVVTMPIVALMVGQVSLVSVAANVLVAAVTAPITILGLVAVILSLFPGGLETPVLWLIQPMTWWINAVAATGSTLPVSTIDAGPLAVLIAYGWVLAGVFLGRARVTVVALVGIVVLTSVGAPWQRPLDIAHLNAHVVSREEEIEPVPPHTQVVIVLEKGAPRTGPAVTKTRIPILYPHRDGPVRLYPDGTQHAESGKF